MIVQIIILLTLQVLEPVQWVDQRDSEMTMAGFPGPRHASVPIKVRPLGILWRVNPSQVPSCHAEVPRSLEPSSKLDRARSALYRLGSARCGLLEEEVQLLFRLHSAGLPQGFIG